MNRADGENLQTASNADAKSLSDPDDAEALHRKGLLALGEGRHDQAVQWISSAIRRDPKPLYLTSLGTALLAQGRREEAVAAFDKAVQIEPDDADLWRNLALALVETGGLSDAILCLQQALKLDPRHFDAAHKAALLLHQQGRYEEALGYFNLSAELRPDHFATLYMRARALQMLNRFDEALADNERAQVLDPKSADVRYNLATVLTELRRFDEAIAVYHQALAANPADADAQWSLALLQLRLGDFESGWAAQEARWNVPSLSAGYPEFVQPKWLGAEPVAGKTVIVCANEGFGDSIQLVRYVPMLAARGARVILLVPEPLCSLLSGLEGVARCLPSSVSPLPDCDFHVPVSNLPLAFGTRLQTIPDKVPYLPRPADAHVQAWQARLGAHDRLRVGLVWSGNPSHGNDRNRSLPLRLLNPLLGLEAQFVSLQKHLRADDCAILAQSGIVELTADLADFADTAALMACLDLVISVDTSAAHLAGALARETWILLPYMPDYRWLLDRDDSPWYPAARLFRQSKARDWREVIARVRDELALKIAAWPASRTTARSASPAPTT